MIDCLLADLEVLELLIGDELEYLLVLLELQIVPEKVELVHHLLLDSEVHVCEIYPSNIDH